MYSPDVSSTRQMLQGGGLRRLWCRNLSEHSSTFKVLASVLPSAASRTEGGLTRAALPLGRCAAEPGFAGTKQRMSKKRSKPPQLRCAGICQSCGSRVKASISEACVVFGRCSLFGLVYLSNTNSQGCFPPRVLHFAAALRLAAFRLFFCPFRPCCCHCSRFC